MADFSEWRPFGMAGRHHTTRDRLELAVGLWTIEPSDRYPLRTIGRRVGIDGFGMARMGVEPPVHVSTNAHF